MIKMIALLKRKPDLSHAEFVGHWRKTHGPLAQGIPGLRRYIQSHIETTRSRPDIPDIPVEVDGIAELWFDDMAAMETVHQDARMQRLLADGALFISEIRTFMVHEVVIVEGGENFA
jgi:uncharacterized protein (TIGR02118 family)